MSTVALVVVLLAIVLGAFVQSTVGIGLGLVAAPVVTLAAPQLMPGGMLMVVVLLPIVTLARERDEIDWGGLRWAFPARVVGTAVGVWVVASVDDRQLGIAVGAMVLVAVLLTARTVVIPVNRGTLSGAGFVSGVTGTASSIGGPPLALLLQRRSPRQIRTTLAVYFLLGSLLSLVGLAWAGELTVDEAWFALAAVPALVLGFVVSGPLRRRLPAHVVRPLVLLVSGASAVALIVRSTVG
ncbi:sulfite exporter TauE/SafE family protein [Aeromicrobium sp. 50.2.37]|uniref:sulfite exporter TauE/SafE family protein n=1 Tax=Aeromicrobium sp. 50.2.37 TaxID=2969305 RepID=UPI00214FD481|nr:sulfite exporter TauE/SafE family protein [Aeromicrobium sp. 50.2.37]MCR4514032.1 sulfite exporter TauE/SafE family protein [Aeromicrobium sp. 50.2.37]